MHARATHAFDSNSHAGSKIAISNVKFEIGCEKQMESEHERHVLEGYKIRRKIKQKMMKSTNSNRKF
jgi:hypothetical protein